MKKLLTDFRYILVSVVFFGGVMFYLTSCEKEDKEVKGCTDSAATNYNANATISDNSTCLYNNNDDDDDNNDDDNNDDDNNDDDNTSVTCPTFNLLEVTWGGNSYSATSSIISCSSMSGTWRSDMGTNSGRRVRVVFASQPTTAKEYTIVEGEDGKVPGANECYILIQYDATTELYSKGGGKAVACTTVEGSDNVTRVQWENVTFVYVLDSQEVQSSGQTGCL